MTHEFNPLQAETGNRSAVYTMLAMRGMYASVMRLPRPVEDSTVDELSDETAPVTPGVVVINTGAVIAVLLGIPCVFVALFGAAGFLSGQKFVAGGFGAAWGYLAAAGAYELNRRKFGWSRGSKHCDLHLFGGTLAVALGLIIAGALHETMPAIAIVPACSAILQANDGHRSRYRSMLHAAVLAAGSIIGGWMYQNGVIGPVWLKHIATLP